MGELVKGPWPEPPQANMTKLMVAKRFGVTVRTVERWMNDGLPHERDADGHARFRQSETTAWVRERDGRVA